VSVRPGVTITQRSTPSPRANPADTGVWSVVGITDAGPLAPSNSPAFTTLIQSMADFERLYGLRSTVNSLLYDELDLFFREGGSRAWVSRVVGPAAAVATKNLLDVGAGISLVATSIGPGSFYNTVKIGVRAGTVSGFVIFIQDANNVEVETSPDLATQNAAILWSQSSNYVRLTLGATALNPNPAAAAVLAGGNLDQAGIADAQWQAALDRITSDFGTGQVSAPGRVTAVGHAQVLAHARTNRRDAILDGTDTATTGTVTTLAAADRVGDQRFGGLFWPWLIIPGIVAGTFRTVPPCGLVAGILARNDASGLGPAAPAAGDAGVSRYATGLTQAGVTDTVRQTMNASSVNVIRMMYASARVYGWRSLVDPTADPDWVNLGSVRLYMAISADASLAAEGFAFDKIDGQGKKIAEFNGVLKGILMDYYSSGDLYGDTADQAFYVDTGPNVNTPTRLANNELHAVLNVKMSPFAEWVQIEIVKRPITEGVL
jgi:hypothetical protein